MSRDLDLGSALNDHFVVAAGTAILILQVKLCEKNAIEPKCALNNPQWADVLKASGAAKSEIASILAPRLAALGLIISVPKNFIDGTA